MPTIAETEFAALDFEGAGARPGASDEPVQVGIVLMRGGVASACGGLNSYVAAGVPVTWKARMVHGISDAELKDAPPLLELWPRIKSLLGGRWVVAHGSATERRFLRAFPFHGFGPWVDTLKLSRALEPGLPSHALGDLCAHYGIENRLRGLVPGFRWHDAFCDALASLVLLEHFISARGLSNEPPDLLLRVDDSEYHRNKARNRFP